MDEGFTKRALALNGLLPEGARIVASYATMSMDTPNVMVVEADDAGVLFQINDQYRGYLAIEWEPALSAGGEQAERESFAAAASGNARG